MRLKNKDGTPVDPVPFAVVSLLGALILISWGPLYLKAHGLAESVAVSISIICAFGVVGAAYHRYILTSDPGSREEIPAEQRYLRLLYGIFIGVIVLLALIALLYI